MRALPGLLVCVALAVTPAGAAAGGSLPDVGSGHRPGPDIWYPTRINCRPSGGAAATVLRPAMVGRSKVPVRHPSPPMLRARFRSVEPTGSPPA